MTIAEIIICIILHTIISSFAGIGFAFAYCERESMYCGNTEIWSGIITMFIWPISLGAGFIALIAKGINEILHMRGTI